MALNQFVSEKLLTASHPKLTKGWAILSLILCAKHRYAIPERLLYKPNDRSLSPEAYTECNSVSSL